MVFRVRGNGVVVRAPAQFEVPGCSIRGNVGVGNPNRSRHSLSSLRGPRNHYPSRPQVQECCPQRQESLQTLRLWYLQESNPLADGAHLGWHCGMDEVCERNLFQFITEIECFCTCVHFKDLKVWNGLLQCTVCMREHDQRSASSNYYTISHLACSQRSFGCVACITKQSFEIEPQCENHSKSFKSLKWMQVHLARRLSSKVAASQQRRTFGATQLWSGSWCREKSRTMVWQSSVYIQWLPKNMSSSPFPTHVLINWPS